jgi:hypothetical protein
VPALAPEIELAMTRTVAFIEMDADFHQLADRLRSFRHNRAHNFFVAEPGAGFDRVAHMQLERIFITRDASNPPCAHAVLLSAPLRL